jgi:saccharopine dehydrogenase-like NADP-dependent oxidoreductase
MKHVFVLGTGQIGTLIACMLAETNDYKVSLIDKDPAAEDRLMGADKGRSISFVHADVEDSGVLARLFKNRAASSVVSALPYYHNVTVAKAARKYHLHYFDLTEDVFVARTIRKIAEGAETAFVPQCGLAPGFISIAAQAIINKFQSPQTVRLRVGALPQYPSNLLKYALTWSTEGLINEYGNSCHCIIDGKPAQVRPLEGLEEIKIDGTSYEAFHTSGGLGSLAETYDGKVSQMDYKTIRYPGHCDKIRLLMNELRLNNDRDTLKRIFENALPRTMQDVVIVFVSVCGMKNGKLLEQSYVNKFYPLQFDGRLWSAIQVTTAAGLCSVMDHVLMSSQSYAGFFAQEQFQFQGILCNRFGRFLGGNGNKTADMPLYGQYCHAGPPQGRSQLVVNANGV